MIYTNQLPLSPFNKKEILRYCGVPSHSPDLDDLIDECINELQGKISNCVCFKEFPVTLNDGICDLGFIKTDSSLVKRHLGGCSSIVLFAATVGIGIDRLIARYSRLSPSKALIFQAIGAERIESLCDSFENLVSQKYALAGKSILRRISPGYGDLPLDTQREIFSVLSCHSKIGLSLNESLLMSPSKSVTAIIGICDKPSTDEVSGCNACSKNDCSFRRSL